jgi:hypothetical protein
MPFMKDRVAATYAKVILRVFTGNEVAENSVVDGTQVPLNGDNRRILEAGTVMVWTGAVGSSKVKPAGASGELAAQRRGHRDAHHRVLARRDRANKDDAPIGALHQELPLRLDQAAGLLRQRGGRSRRP